MKRLTVLAGINSYTGYGLHAIQIVRDLQYLTGAHVNIRPLSQSEAFGAGIPPDIRARFVNCVQPEPWELLLHPPNFRPTLGKKTVYFTMWEATRLPPFGVQFLNQAAVVVVPCEWNAACFSAQGVNVPIRVVPLGIDPEVFRFRYRGPREISPLTGEPAACVFGAAGRMAHGGVRKGINEVIRLFQDTFPKRKDVLLKVKCFPDCPTYNLTDQRIQITKAYLSDEKMAEWYASLDCFVSAARSEGWGLMQQQAMSVGRPVISIEFGGVAEFLNEENAMVVPHVLEPAQGTYLNCGHWALPDWKQMQEMMRYVYHHPEAALNLGGKASNSVARFTWKASHAKLLAVLKEFKAI